MTSPKEARSMVSPCSTNCGIQPRTRAQRSRQVCAGVREQNPFTTKGTKVHEGETNSKCPISSLVFVAAVPTGLFFVLLTFPSAEALGYWQMFLRNMESSQKKNVGITSQKKNLGITSQKKNVRFSNGTGVDGFTFLDELLHPTKDADPAIAVA